MDSSGGPMDTRSPEYTRRLESRADVWWKRLIPVQAPYLLHLKLLRLGRTLDVGCGVGRYLAWLPSGSVGVDHNSESVQACRRRGLTAVTPEELRADIAQTHRFDSILMSHLLEHVGSSEVRSLGRDYLPYLRRGGRVVMICPQEKGYKSDPSHVRFVDDDVMSALAAEWGLKVLSRYSFPFPRPAGRWFTYNEFVCVASAP
jgi:SAM-dependent methyltransferase